MKFMLGMTRLIEARLSERARSKVIRKIMDRSVLYSWSTDLRPIHANQTISVVCGFYKWPVP